MKLKRVEPYGKFE